VLTDFDLLAETRKKPNVYGNYIEIICVRFRRLDDNLDALFLLAFISIISF